MRHKHTDPHSAVVLDDLPVGHHSGALAHKKILKDVLNVYSRKHTLDTIRTVKSSLSAVHNTQVFFLSSERKQKDVVNTVRYLFFFIYIPLLEREQQILVVSLSWPPSPHNGSRVQSAIKCGGWSLRGFNTMNRKRGGGGKKLVNATQLCTPLEKGAHGTDDHTNTLLENARR